MNAEAPVLEPPPPKGTRARGRWLRRVLALLALLFVVAFGALVWLMHTQSGANFALGQARRAAGEGVRYEGVEGSLEGLLRIRLIEVKRKGLYVRVEDFEMRSHLLGVLGGRLLVDRLSAARVEVRTASTGDAAQLPVSFAPPRAVRLEEGRIGELRLGGLDAPRERDLVVKEIFLRGEGDESHWKIEEARADTPYAKGRVAGTIATRAPFDLDANADVEGVAADRPFKAQLTAKGTLRALEARLDGEVSGQKANARLALEPFAPMPVRTLEAHARDVDLSQQAAGPKTKLAIDVRLDAAGGKAFAGPVKIENAEPGAWDAGRLPFSAASARVVVTAERVEIPELDVALAGGGRATGSARLEKSGVQAQLRVADVDLMALHGGLQKTRMTGRVVAEGNAAAQRFDVQLHDLRFDIEGRAALAHKRLDVESARLRTGGGALTATGTLALEGRKEFSASGRAEHFDPSAFVKTAKGDLSFAFVASGALADGVSGEAKLDIAPSTWSGLAAGGHIYVAGDRRRIASSDVDVTLGEARVTARGAFGRAGDAMDLTFRAPNLAALAQPLGVALAGSAQGEARLTGTFAAPAGRLSLTGANLALPSNVFVRELTARVEAGSEPESPVDAAISASGVAMGKDPPPTTLAETGTITVKGTRLSHRLELAARMSRDNDVRLALQGGLDPRAKEPTWTGRVESLALSGRGAFSLAAPATLEVSAARVELGEARLKGEWGETDLQITRWTPRALDVKGSSSGIQVQNLARSLRIQIPRSTLVIAGDWEVHAAETFDGTVNLRRVSGDLRVGEPPLPLELQEVVLRAQSLRGRATASVVIAGDRTGRVQGEGSGLIVRGARGWSFAADAPVQAHLTATHTNLASLAQWIGPDARLGGRLNADVTITGTGADPRVSGSARAEDLVVREPQTGFELEQGTVAVRLDGRSLAIDRLSATVPWHPSERAREKIAIPAPAGGGRMSAEGAIDLAARTGAIRLKLDHVPVTQLETRFLALSGEARLEAGNDGMLVAGKLVADAGWVGALATALPSVADDVVVVRAAQPASAEGPKREPIRLDMQLGLGDHAYFQGRGLDARLAGEIRLNGTPGPGLRASGSIRAVEGTYDGYGQKLAIERGVLTFVGPIDNPRLNVLALRKGLAVEAGVEVLGTTTRPRVRLVSNPDVPEPEKLSWLVLGRGASDASLGDSAVMMAAARALLGSRGEGTDLTRKLGFDEFRIGRADNTVLGVLPQSTVAGRTRSPSATDTVSVGKRINDNVHLTLEQGLADAEGALKLTWRLTEQFQVLVRAGYLPGLDAVYRWSFQ